MDAGCTTKAGKYRRARVFGAVALVEP